MDAHKEWNEADFAKCKYKAVGQSVDFHGALIAQRWCGVRNPEVTDLTFQLSGPAIHKNAAAID